MTDFDRGQDAPGATLIRLPGGGRWLAALAACLVVAGATLLGAGMARAATIDGAITSITTTATTTKQWDRVDFACTWAVPDGSAPGDTFGLQLPPQLRWFGPSDFDLAAPDGQPVAHAHADATGAVVFTLTDYLLTHPLDVHGTCHFSTQYAAATTNETVHLDFTVGDQVVRVDLPTTEPCARDCAADRTEPSKYMWWDDTAQTLTQSVVRAPATTLALSDVTITDRPGPGLALDCTTLRATIGRVLDADGNVTAPRDDAQYVPVVACTPQGLSVTWSDVPAGEYTELWVRATVVDPSLSTYGNDGSVVVDGRTTPVHDTVRHSDAGGDGEGTPSPTTSSSTTSTTTSPSPTTTSPTTTPTTTKTTTTTTTTAPTTTTSPTTTATGTGTVTAPATTDTTKPTPGTTKPTTQPSSTDATVVATGSGTTGGAQASTVDTVLAFTGVDALHLAGIAGFLLGSGVLLGQLGQLGRRGRRH